MHVLSPWFRTPAALLCALPVLAQAPDGDLAERLYRSGERAYASKAYKEALDTWGQLLQTSPQSEFAPKVLLRLAQHQVDVERKPEAAMPHLDRLRSEYIKSPEAADGLLLRGILQGRQARRPAELKDAMADFNRVLDLFPDAGACAEARLQLGRAWRDQGQWGRALQHFVEAFRLHAGSAVAPRAMLEAAGTMDLSGDLPGCLRMLQQLRTEHPQTPEAQEAAWRTSALVKHRLQKPPLRSEGPWPAGRAKWLKTPTLLALAPDGELLIFQHDLDRVFRLHGAELVPQGPPAPGTRVLCSGPGGALWQLSKNALVREEGGPAQPLGTLAAISGAALDRWGNLWVADAKTPALTLFTPEGGSRTMASPTAGALAPLPTGGLVISADADRKLLFLDADGQPRIVVPYGKDLPAPFKAVTALATDGVGHVAALVDGGEFGEGVVIFGPDGAVLRYATFKALGISGRITSLVMDRSGGLILCDRRNDLLIRLN
ncbi:MAG: outer membrane protein assembly factor BamD [Geothrix sp.]|uniref:outer membrane protein assembly factor BamD n=1 Tax=Geothrix sp. TaxID=1962974 RepID=UPI0017C96C24|nr:outer membrane protein assembly factor BamD [Geothrix sp.]NWJ41418.1 outer membrane protein assembly factor BamD [Geothrix sp.]WIL20595.1 MAG: outer membrane protein assembly factor BamD [Geothrix sp.]